jgi:glycosyltransferase involved in cell wall biosynthesis
VVDDGSQDHTADVVTAYKDSRVHYIYQENKGLPGARNTGIRHAQGDLFAFLDADDQFHPQKLAAQVALLQRESQVGLVYNSRITVDSKGNRLALWRAPATTSLADLLLGYNFTPSDVMIRRVWAERVDLFDESYVLNSEDLNFHLRLALAGCRFASVDRALTIRQIHINRIFKNLAGKMETYIRALDTAFDHPRCPEAILSLRPQAYANHYLIWGWQAAVQQETELTHRFLSEAIRLQPRLLKNEGQAVLKFITAASARDGGDHEARLRLALPHLPPELACVARQENWAVARGYLLRGVSDLMWERPEQAHSNMAKAVALNGRLDDAYLHTLNDQLLNYEHEFGTVAAQQLVHHLQPYLEKVGTQAQIRQFTGRYFINRAFSKYQEGVYNQVPSHIIKALSANPAIVANRGVWSIFFRSLLSSI